MIKFILKLITVSILFMVTIKAQNSSPVIYQTFIREDVGLNGGKMLFLDALTFNEIGKIVISPSNPKRIELTADKKLAFVNHNPFVDDKKGMTVVDLEQKKVIRRMFENIGVYEMKLAPDGMMWVLLDEPHQIAVINPKNLETTERLTFNESPRDVIFSPDGKRVYISLFTKDIVVLNTVTKTSITIIRNLPIRSKFQVRPQELELSSDGSTLYIGSRETVSIVDTTTFRVINSFQVINNSINSDLLLKISPDNKILYVAPYLGFSFSAYDINSKKVTILRPNGGFSKGTISFLQPSPDNRLLYITQDYGVLLLDLATNDFIANLQTSTGVNFPHPFSGGITLTGDFSIGQAPTLQTTSPITSQQVIAGQPVTIKWQTTVAAQSYSIASHMLELSTDSGATFAVIKGAEELSPTTQEFTWTAPNIEVMDKAQIRVSTVDLGARRANSTTGNFSIIKTTPGDTQAPMVTFLSPKGSERFTSGDNLQISWVSSDNVAVTSQDLSLSTDGGVTFPITIVSGLPGTTQSFSFPIPMTLQSDQARLRLIVRDGAENSSQTITPANFRVELGADTLAPTVTISQPSSNQSLIAGQSIQVKWQSVDNRAVASQALLLSLDGGRTFATIASFGASDNSFVINNIDRLNFTNAQAIVRITATDSSGNIGQANVQFVISPAITNAIYKAKILTLSGIGFMSNSTSSTVKLFVNEKETTITPMTISNTSFTIKGSKKKLGGIVRGNNTVRLIIDGVASNTLTFTF